MNEYEKQITVTQFIYLWIKIRVPHLRNFFKQDAHKDPIHTEIGIVRDLEIIDIIFNGDSDYYNYRTSKNTAEVEDRLSRIFEMLDSLPEDFTVNQESALADQTERTIRSDVVYEVALAKRPQYTSYYFVHNINVFQKYKGFEGLLSVIKECSVER